jgi:hypothetical protein
MADKKEEHAKRAWKTGLLDFAAEPDGRNRCACACACFAPSRAVRAALRCAALRAAARRTRARAVCARGVARRTPRTQQRACLL